MINVINNNIAIFCVIIIFVICIIIIIDFKAYASYI